MTLLAWITTSYLRRYGVGPMGRIGNNNECGKPVPAKEGSSNSRQFHVVVVGREHRRSSSFADTQ